MRDKVFSELGEFSENLSGRLLKFSFPCKAVSVLLRQSRKPTLKVQLSHFLDQLFLLLRSKSNDAFSEFANAH
jgi:hypothetical protein